MFIIRSKLRVPLTWYIEAIDVKQAMKSRRPGFKSELDPEIFSLSFLFLPIACLTNAQLLCKFLQISRFIDM